MLLGRFCKNTTWSVYNSVTRTLQNHIRNYTGLPEIVLNLTKLSISKIENVEPILYRQFCSDDKNLLFEGIEDYGLIDELIIKKFIEKDFYPVTKDQTLISMKSLVHVNEIFKHFENFKDQYNAQTITQALQKIYLYYQAFPTQKFESVDKLNTIIKYMDKFIKEMNTDEVTNCLWYLSKLGINDNLHNKKLLLKCDAFLNAEDDIHFSTLSKISYMTTQINEFTEAPVYKRILFHTLKNLEYCNDAEGLYYITTCLHNIIPFVSHDDFEKYKEKIDCLLLKDEFKNSSVKYFVKFAKFLSFPKWSNKTSSINRQLLILISNNIETIDLKELEITFKLFQNILEPAEILPKLLNTSKKMYECNPTVELLSSIANFDQTDRKNLIYKAKEILENDIPQITMSKMLPPHYKLLRSLKISDIKLCTLYWNRVLKEIKANVEERNEIRLIRHCFCYMFFNNNLGGTFRHLEFEHVLSKLALESLTKNEENEQPEIFSWLASFIIAYGIKNEKGVAVIPDIIITKMEQMKNKFDNFDCLRFSKGLQIALELRFRSKMKRETISKIHKIESIVTDCIMKYLEIENVDLAKLNSIVKTLTNIKVQTTSDLFVKVAELYKKPHLDINSRSIREVAFNLLASNYLVSDIITHSFNYIHKNRNYVLGDTVEKILHTAYTLSYIPENEEILYWLGEIIKRDFSYMTTMAIVRGSLALCFYRALPNELVKKIFTPEFIKRIQDEIELCYSKQTYPNRILSLVMQLNRAVCLDYPEIQLPWFQQNYIEAQMSKKPIIRSKLSTEIENVLLTVVKDKSHILPNQSTPYGYVIDFVVYLDYSQNLLNSKYSHLDNFSTFAILLLKQNAYCKNENDNIKGFEHMRIRHLEMLGFNVIHINVTDWNALHMNIPGAKKSFLKNLLRLL